MPHALWSKKNYLQARTHCGTRMSSTIWNLFHLPFMPYHGQMKCEQWNDAQTVTESGVCVVSQSSLATCTWFSQRVEASPSFNVVYAILLNACLLTPTCCGAILSLPILLWWPAPSSPMWHDIADTCSVSWPASLSYVSYHQPASDI